MSRLSERLEKEIEAVTGQRLAVEEDGSRVVVTGFVDTPEARVDVLGVVRAEAGDRQIEDGIEVVEALPEEMAGIDLSDEDAGAFRGARPGLADAGEALEAVDFTDRDTLAWSDEAAGPSGNIEKDRTSEGGTVYTPPIDPVGTNTEVIGGFQRSSMDSMEVEKSSLDNEPGDEAQRDAILRELNEDAATHLLELDVVVNRGVAHVRGHVPYLEDAENAEAVASRIPGVRYVIDETVVDQFAD